MAREGTVLSVRDLCIGIRRGRHVTTVVERIELDLNRGQTLALVGESGCGKSLTALALLGLLPPGAELLQGEIRLDGELLDTSNQGLMTRLRGGRVATVFQEPMNALNPVFTVGQQIGESLRIHGRGKRRERDRQVHDILQAVGITDPDNCAASYPHQLSGGMRQRALIAMAIACRPGLLIADEPSTALDVTVQAQVVNLLMELQQRFGMAMLFISHDFAVVSHVADRIAVMYAGTLVESGPASDVLQSPKHPYTAALMTTRPELGRVGQRLPTIEGQVPVPGERGEGCVFAARCAQAVDRCRMVRPRRQQLTAQHDAACHLI